MEGERAGTERVAMGGAMRGPARVVATLRERVALTPTPTPAARVRPAKKSARRSGTVGRSAAKKGSCVTRESVCSAATESRHRGPQQECCDEGEVCHLDACITLGMECGGGESCATSTDLGDCPEGEVCDEYLGACVPAVIDESCVYVPPESVFDPVPLFTWGERPDSKLQ